MLGGVNFNLPNVSSVTSGGGLAALNPVGILGNLAIGGANYLSQAQTNQANTDNINNQMNFQREMSNTAEQRAMKDRLAAGINPKLSQGGASTPSGGAAQLTAPQLAAIPFMEALNLNESMLNNQVMRENTRAETALKSAQSNNLRADTLLKGEQLTSEKFKASVWRTAHEVKDFTDSMTVNRGIQAGKQLLNFIQKRIETKYGK